MSVLTEPTPRVHASFVEAIREYREEGRYSRLEPEMLAGQDQFGRYLDLLRADARPGVLRRRYRVPQTNLWLTDGDEFLGQLSIRHALNRRLRYKGGHIGYSVRPSRRRRGYATLMLRLSLPVANGFGIDPALITCDDTNVASRRVIEANGGSLASASDGILRFWVPTAPRMLWRQLSAGGSRSCGRPAPRRRWAAASHHRGAPVRRGAHG